MSRKRRRRASRAPLLAALVVALALLVVASRLLPRVGRGPAPRHSHDPAPRLESASPAPATPRPLAVRLYYLRIVGGKERMVPVVRTVPAASPARSALQDLLSGDPPAGCQPPLPAGVALRSVRVSEGVATADFSRELVSGFRGGSDNEGVTVYSIVNTLCSLPGIEKAQILVAGEPVDSLGGHLDTSGPLAPDQELVVSE